MVKKSVRGVAVWSLVAAMVIGCGAVVRAQDEEAAGPVIQIGKSDADSNTASPDDGLGSDSATAPAYWIGLVGGPIGPDHVLRAHVDIPEGQGLLVVSVVPEGPAAKAGLKANDILLRANDSELGDMHDLVKLVTTEGEKQGQIAIDVLRRGERETVYVTPQKRPAAAARAQGGIGRSFGSGLNLPGGVELPEELMQQFAEGPFEFRNFGPGVILGGGGGLANMPNGVSVSVEKRPNQPTRITVQRGDETWEVSGDDAESLEKLPADLRPFVKQLLHGPALNLNFRQQQERLLPELGDGRLQERLERMEQRMQELQERLQNRDADAAGQPNDGDAESTNH